MIVDLLELKGHLRVDPGNHDEDDDIESYGLAAEVQVQHWLGRPIYATAVEMPASGSSLFDPYQMVADQAVKVAIKQLVGRFYGPDREAAGSTAEDAVLPASVRSLLAGHRVFHKVIETPSPSVAE
ncbi:head-tail connector protein [Paracoccus litorisediminis]|uniref:Phage gp6-like head-tail connector protein n=1 Tax=Paracoccus litorisediminis TaxID=2006130 RepID=A0A844HQK6_9RHOB|nr:head-tail connector protein [Paracoccus litorisediminis]MTH61439.1 hypothetical protein [Paracoccus litorisediminis]